MFFKSFKIIITIIFFFVSIQSAFSEGLIKPQKKPDLSNKTIKKKLSSNFIIPTKKPIKENGLKIKKKITKVAKKKTNSN